MSHTFRRMSSPWFSTLFLKPVQAPTLGSLDTGTSPAPDLVLPLASSVVRLPLCLGHCSTPANAGLSRSLSWFLSQTHGACPTDRWVGCSLLSVVFFFFYKSRASDILVPLVLTHQSTFRNRFQKHGCPFPASPISVGHFFFLPKLTGKTILYP